VLTVWDWGGGQVRSFSREQTSGTFGALAAVDREGNDPFSRGGDRLVRIRDDLSLEAVGCLPSGSWVLSPDGGLLAEIVWDASPLSAVVVPLAEVLERRDPRRYWGALPHGSANLAWSADNHLDVSVVLAQGDYPRRLWGLARCSYFTGACEREMLPTGETAAAVGVAPPVPK
jgi:hypothetical protein